MASECSHLHTGNVNDKCYVLGSGNYGYSNEKPDCRYKSINISKYTVHQYLAQTPDIPHVYVRLYDNVQIEIYIQFIL